jgi:outer membrane protein OmpA-like peptidoglycan-associated protein
MKKLQILGFFLLLSLASPVFAQYQLGYYNSNFGGVSSIRTNPANAADNRMKFQLNIINIGFNFSNNYLVTETPYSFYEIAKAGIKDPTAITDSFNGVPVWQDSYLKEVLNGKDKTVNISNDIMGPSFFVGLGKNFGLAYSNRVKTTVQLNGMNESLVRLARYSLDFPSLNNEFHADAKFGLMVNSYAENALTFGGVIINKEQHFLKGGVTVKSLTGIYNMYIQNKGVNINFYDSDSLVLTQNEISYGYVKEQYYGIFAPSGSNRTLSLGLNETLKRQLGGGLGFDFGVVYEFRPKWSDFYQSIDNEMKWKRDRNKYLYKIGVSLNDLGSINYSSSEWVRQYQLRLLSNADTVKWGQLDTLGLTTTSSFSGAVGKIIKHTDSATSYSVGLPTTFNINFDWRINRYFYVSGNWVQSLRKTNAIAVRTPSMLAISPRVEFRHLEFALPMMSAFDYTKFQIGAFARFGPIFIGSDNIGGFFGKTTFNGIDLYAGATIPLYHKAWKDKDQDGVSNKMDKCDGEKGPWETKGCPDKDGDKIVDKDDQCPDVAGIKDFKGCPDTDKDGIADKEDDCPTVAGIKEFKGCPDTDKDGIADKEDKCPTIAGKAFLNGCPDSDNDSITDVDDKCPTVAGLKSLMGCPDTDKDGITDAEDNCPTEAGSIKTKGCPDTDKDGIADKEDKCPTIAGLIAFKGCKDSDLDGISDPDDKCPNEYGTKENNGCPLVVKKDVVSANLEAEEQEILKKAFETLTFETGKSIISSQSKVGLDSLAMILVQKPAYFLQVSGHTDNDGGVAKNQALSLSRATEVKTYLVAKGVPANRIVAKGFGSSVPVAPNTSPENKRKNRRVELKVYKP